MDTHAPLSLLQRPITFITGKGGVGKSSVAAALGLLSAERGKTTLVAELGTDGHLARVFGTALAHAPKHIAQQLDAANFRVEDGLAATLSSFIPFERVVRSVVQNRILQMFIETAPSISEAVLLDAVAQRRAHYDHIIVELPASGHAITLLQVPQMLRRLVRLGPIAKKADELEAAILMPDVAQIVLVALPEALPVQETIELATKLRAISKLEVRAILLNQTMSPLVQGKEREMLEKLAAEAKAKPLERHLRHMLDAARRDDLALSELRAKLDVPVYLLPRVMAAENPQDILGPIREALAS